MSCTPNQRYRNTLTEWIPTTWADLLTAFLPWQSKTKQCHANLTFWKPRTFIELEVRVNDIITKCALAVAGTWIPKAQKVVTHSKQIWQKKPHNACNWQLGAGPDPRALTVYLASKHLKKEDPNTPPICCFSMAFCKHNFRCHILHSAAKWVRWAVFFNLLC